MTAVVVGVHGPSCSGKTTFALELGLWLEMELSPRPVEDVVEQKAGEMAKFFSQNSSAIAVVHQDDYYIESLDKIPKVRVGGYVCHDWDCPESLEVDSLTTAIQEQCQRRRVVIVEGSMLAGVAALHAIVDVWILLAASEQLCSQRRRERTYEGTVEVPGYFEQHAFPASERMKWRLIRTYLDTAAQPRLQDKWQQRHEPQQGVADEEVKLKKNKGAKAAATGRQRQPRDLQRQSQDLAHTGQESGSASPRAQRMVLLPTATSAERMMQSTLEIGHSILRLLYNDRKTVDPQASTLSPSRNHTQPHTHTRTHTCGADCAVTERVDSLFGIHGTTCCQQKRAALTPR